METTNAGRAYKKPLAGVVHTGDGLFVYAKLRARRGRWDVEAVDSWPASNILKTTLRLSGGAVSGLRAEWRRTAPGPALEPAASAANPDINPYLRADGAGVILETLSGSVTSVVADDSFLLTLPLAFCANPPESFLSVYTENNVAAFGVIIAKKLEAVFSFPCDTARGAEAAAGRIKRYWRRGLKRDDFPANVFVLNRDAQGGGYDGLDVEPLALPDELLSGGAVRAAGAALSVPYPSPAFKLPPRYGFRRYRSLLLNAAAVLFCLSLLITSASALMNARAGIKLRESEKVYHSRMVDNKTLQNLNKTADGLAAEIFAVRDAYAKSTHWGDFLLLLSEIKPDGLFLERLGSDYAAGSESGVRLALAGWSQTETSVTVFISGLQDASGINNVSLTSIERDTKNKNIYRFKILCTIQLFND